MLLLMRGDLIALVSGVILVGLLTVEYRLKVRALERRGKPKWHAFFGMPALLEILLNRTTKDRQKLHSPPTGKPRPGAQNSAESDRPIPVVPKEGPKPKRRLQDGQSS